MLPDRGRERLADIAEEPDVEGPLRQGAIATRSWRRMQDGNLAARSSRPANPGMELGRYVDTFRSEP